MSAFSQNTTRPPYPSDSDFYSSDGGGQSEISNGDIHATWDDIQQVSQQSGTSVVEVMAMLMGPQFYRSYLESQTASQPTHLSNKSNSPSLSSEAYPGLTAERVAELSRSPSSNQWNRSDVAIPRSMASNRGSNSVDLSHLTQHVFVGKREEQRREEERRFYGSRRPSYSSYHDLSTQQLAPLAGAYPSQVQSAFTGSASTGSPKAAKRSIQTTKTGGSSLSTAAWTAGVGAAGIAAAAYLTGNTSYLTDSQALQSVRSFATAHPWAASVGRDQAMRAGGRYLFSSCKGGENAESQASQHETTQVSAPTFNKQSSQYTIDSVSVSDAISRRTRRPISRHREEDTATDTHGRPSEVPQASTWKSYIKPVALTAAGLAAVAGGAYAYNDPSAASDALSTAYSKCPEAVRKLGSTAFSTGKSLLYGASNYAGSFLGRSVPSVIESVAPVSVEPVIPAGNAATEVLYEMVGDAVSGIGSAASGVASLWRGRS